MPPCGHIAHRKGIAQPVIIPLKNNVIVFPEQALCREQSDLFRKYYHIIFEGDYYRLSNPFTVGNMTAWQHVLKDKSESLLSVVVTNLTCNGPQEYVKAKGLDPMRLYTINGGEEVYSGSALMNAGIPIEREVPEYTAFQFHIKASGQP